MTLRNRIVVITHAAAAACVGLCVHGQARAQQANGNQVDTAVSATNAVDSSSYSRGSNVGVLDRARPDYEAIGIHLGSFTIYPKVDIGLAYDTNIYAAHTGAVGDAIISVDPEVDFQSNWSRDALSGRVWAQQDLYAKYSVEDDTQYGAALAGKFQFGDSNLTGGVDSGEYVLPRADSNNIGAASTHPIAYNYTALNAELSHEFARLRLTARFDYQDYTYDNGVTSTGATVFDQDLNRQSLIYTGKAEFAITPDTAVYATAIGNNQLYPNDVSVIGFNRNSSGYEVDLGANFDITRLIRGQLQVGYLEQNYVSHLFGTVTGPSAQGQIEWFPTALTTVTLQGSRAVADALVPGSAGYVTSNAKLEIDHELLRNLILSANASVGQDHYDGIGRTDDRGGVGLSAHWLLNRRVGLNFAYTFTDQRSEGAERGPSFDDNRGSVTTVLQF